MKKYIIYFFLSLSCLLSLNAQNKRVLFIGNSYTEVNNLPSMISSLSTSMGKTLDYETHTMGGARFMTHWNSISSSGLLQKIQTGNFDFIVIQGQSQEVAFPDDQFFPKVYSYAKKLDSIIKLNSPQSKVVFYMTWGYRYGDALNCPSFPPFCTYWSGLYNILCKTGKYRSKLRALICHQRYIKTYLKSALDFTTVLIQNHESSF
ncbi:MAG: hypothetical protein WCR29_00255 [Bacteroidales bacterium]